MALKENYKDDILDVSVNTKRKYRVIDNLDGTVSLEDETVYTQEGDSFGSGDINATNSKVNTIDSAVTTLDANLDGFKFYPTGTGIVGLISDDSAYTDADGNYVVWGTPTAEQLVEDNPNTYKSVPSTEDLRGKVGADSATPFSGLLEKLGIKSGYMAKLYSGYSFSVEQIPNSFTPVSNENAFYIFNFDEKYSLMNMSNGYPEISIVKKDGTVVSIHSGNNDISDAVFGVMFNYNHSTTFTFTAK